MLCLIRVKEFFEVLRYTILYNSSKKWHATLDYFKEHYKNIWWNSNLLDKGNQNTEIKYDYASIESIQYVTLILIG